MSALLQCMEGCPSDVALLKRLDPSRYRLTHSSRLKLFIQLAEMSGQAIFFQKQRYYLANEERCVAFKAPRRWRALQI